MSVRLAAASLVLAGLSAATPAGSATQENDFEKSGERAEAELAAHAPGIGTDFRLRDPAGRVRTLGDFAGKVVVLYFGYTYCPDVCPTDLAQIAKALRALGPLAREVQPLFVTLDPARDSPRALREYVRSFDPRMIALRGSEAEVRQVAEAFRVPFRRVARARGGYDIEHAAFTFVLDRDGRYAEYLPPGTPAGRTEQVLRDVLEATRSGPTS